jgi:hypothetical protein
MIEEGAEALDGREKVLYPSYPREKVLYPSYPQAGLVAFNYKTGRIS